jgi:3-isopropylmalate dehydrogenase
MNITLLAGDGIGPEIMAQAKSVLNAISKKFNHKIDTQEYSIGGAAFRQTGKHLPEETLKGCEQAEAILFGAVGGPSDQVHLPQWRDIAKNTILVLRKHFNLFANLRPIKTQGIDFIIVRELTSGIYFGEHELKVKSKKSKVKSTSQKSKIYAREAYDVMRYFDYEIERILRVGFDTALNRQRKLTLVDKANVLETSRLWRTIAEELKPKYPQVKVEYMLIDNAAMQIIKNPKQFDVIVTSNLFGDILSDQAAVLVKSLGLLASASLNSQNFGLYEPIHGSAPDIAGKKIANPVGVILSLAMMLKYSFKLKQEAQAIEQAVKEILSQGWGTRDISSSKEKTLSTKELGDKIVKQISD